MTDNSPSGEVSGNVYVAKSFRLGMLSWFQVTWSLYGSKMHAALLAVVVGLLAMRLGPAEWLALQMLAQGAMNSLGWPGAALVVLVLLMVLRGNDNGVYLLDFEVATLPDDWMLSHEGILNILRATGYFSEDAMNFQERLLSNSGTSQRTPWGAPAFRAALETGKLDLSKANAVAELEFTVFEPIRKVLARTDVRPKEIDCLVVNCSLFSPTPSLASIVSQEFGLRADCSTFNLSGQGCSAGLIAADLVKQYLAANPNKTCLVVSTENISCAMYTGQQRSFLLQNTLFRAGGAVWLAGNKASHKAKAQFKLLHLVRVQNTDSQAHEAVYETEDDEGRKGVRLSRDVVTVAGKAMQTNLTRLGPLVLPLREQIKSAASLGVRALHKFLEKKGWNSGAIRVPKVDFYLPNFRKGLDHFCVHAGGRAVLDGIEKNLRLSTEDMEPSRTALYNHGNTSSSSIWYELEYVCRTGRLRSGHRVLQLGFGSGFKCNSAVWLCLRPPRR